MLPLVLVLNIQKCTQIYKKTFGTRFQMQDATLWGELVEHEIVQTTSSHFCDFPITFIEARETKQGRSWEDYKTNSDKKWIVNYREQSTYMAPELYKALLSIITEEDGSRSSFNEGTRVGEVRNKPVPITDGSGRRINLL